ncbi:hypothetical protein ACQPT2_11025 [Erwinia amylovora]
MITNNKEFQRDEFFSSPKRGGQVYFTIRRSRMVWAVFTSVTSELILPERTAPMVSGVLRRRGGNHPLFAMPVKDLALFGHIVAQDISCGMAQRLLIGRRGGVSAGTGVCIRPAPPVATSGLSHNEIIFCTPGT